MQMLSIQFIVNKKHCIQSDTAEMQVKIAVQQVIFQACLSFLMLDWLIEKNSSFRVDLHLCKLLNILEIKNKFILYL